MKKARIYVFLCAGLLACLLSGLAGYLLGRAHRSGDPIRIEVSNYPQAETRTIQLGALSVRYPGTWLASREEETVHFYFDHGLFSVYCRGKDAGPGDLNTNERPIPTEGYGDPEEMQLGQILWTVRSVRVDAAEQGLEGFLASTHFGGKTYFVFGAANARYDMHDDFQKVMENLHFASEEPAETTAQPRKTEDGEEMVYITKSGTKYHRADCRWVSDSCIAVDKSEAELRGYTPCGTCHPKK